MPYQPDKVADAGSLEEQLFLEIRRGRAPMVKALLDNGADPDVAEDNADGHTPLVAATLAGNTQIMKILLEAGADPHYSDAGYRSPLRAAIRREDMAAVRLLLHYGADPGYLAQDRAMDGMGGFVQATTDRQIAWDTSEEMRDVVEAAWRRYAVANAAGEGRAELGPMSKLLKEGFSPDGVDFRGCSALMHACNARNVPMIKLLLESGADPEVTMRDGVTTALALACTGSDPKPSAAAVALLLVHGADAKRTGAGGGNALHLLAKHGRDGAAFRLLIENGVSILARDDKGCTPVETAENCKNEAAAAAMREAFQNHVEKLSKKATCLGQPTTAMRAMRFKPRYA